MAEPLTDAASRESNKNSMRVRMEMMIMKIQRDFCLALENEENPKYKFQVDRFIRAEGGGGITCVLQDGHTFEKAGVNISVFHGKLPPAAVAEMNARGKKLPEGKEMPFFACGVSSVVHPRNPNIPTIHFNFRYFEVSTYLYYKFNYFCLDCKNRELSKVIWNEFFFNHILEANHS